MKYPLLFALVLVVLAVSAALTWWVMRKSVPPAQKWVAHTDALRRLPAFQKELGTVRWAVGGGATALIALGISTAVSAGLPIERRVEHPQLASRDIVLCLDASGSMLPFDGQILRNFQEMVESFEGERLSLQLWSAQTLIRFPLTDDYELISSVLGEAAGIIDRGYLGPEGEYVLVTPELADYLEGVEAPDGQLISSLVGDGLATCVTGFDNLDSQRSRTVILATDNEVMGEEIYSLAQAVEYATKNDVDIIALYPAEGGVLTAEGEQLRSVVVGAGGDFYDASDPGAIDAIVDRIEAEQLAELEGDVKIVEQTLPRSALLWAAWSLLAFLMIAGARRI